MGRLLDGGTTTVVGLRALPGVGPMWNRSLDSVHTFAVDNVQAVVDNGGDAAVDAGADASIPNSTLIARGGQGDLQPPGEVFSGAQGQTVEKAGQGVVHGSFRWTTAGDIRAGGGTVEPASGIDPGSRANQLPARGWVSG